MIICVQHTYDWANLRLCGQDTQAPQSQWNHYIRFFSSFDTCHVCVEDEDRHDTDLLI